MGRACNGYNYNMVLRMLVCRSEFIRRFKKMKFKTTKKAMQNNYNTILKVGYCNIQNLLKYQEPIAYSTRAEGWACDYYKVGNVIISEGYSPIGKPVNYDLQQKYNNAAAKLGWEQKEEVYNLLLQFVEEARG